MLHSGIDLHKRTIVLSAVTCVGRSVRDASSRTASSTAPVPSTRSDGDTLVGVIKDTPADGAGYHVVATVPTSRGSGTFAFDARRRRFLVPAVRLRLDPHVDSIGGQDGVARDSVALLVIGRRR